MRHSNFGSLAGFLLVLLACAVPAGAAPGLSTNLPVALPSALPDAGPSVLRVFGALTLVVALFLAGVWVYRNWHRVAARRGRPQYLEILESRSLGGRHALHVVGYQQERLLLASSPTGVSLLSHLPQGDAAPSASAASAADRPIPVAERADPRDFVHVLQKAIREKP